MNQIIPSRSARLAWVIGATLLLAGAPALAAPNEVGRVLVASGIVVASTPGGGTRTLSDGSRVYAGEVIDTRHRGRVQIRFEDGALVSLRPETRFEIARYDSDDTPADDDDGGNVLLRLFRGALRTITGVIGDTPDDQYRLETPVATIGIRGTQFAIQYCTDASCGSGVSSGLYGRVVHGQISVGNDGGSGLFDGGGYFRVTNGDQPPQTILRPPEGVLGAIKGRIGDEGREPGERSGPDRAARGESDSRRPPLRRDRGTDASRPDPEYRASEETGRELAQSQVTLDHVFAAVGAVGEPAVEGEIPGGGVCGAGQECTVAVNDAGILQQIRIDGVTAEVTPSANLVASGTVEALGVTWGHWNGTYEFKAEGKAASLTGDLVWAYGRNPTTASLNDVFAGGGEYTYKMQPSGNGPSLISSSGDPWEITFFQISIQSNQGAWSIGPEGVGLGLHPPEHIVASPILSNSTGATIGPDGFFVDLDWTGQSDTATGTIEGGFIGDQADGMLVEIGVDYFDSDGLPVDTIEGVKVLEREPKKALVAGEPIAP